MISIEGVSKEYSQKDKTKIRVLDEITLSVNDGETIALLGANGSGKSTLLKCLCGVIQPSEGKILVNGQNAFKKRKSLIKNMGVIFNQKPSFIVDLSVMDNMKFFQAIYSIPPKKFQDNIEFLDKYLQFSELLDRPYRKLSFGERVKCEIVSILLHDPKYIYMDEPTIGLDYNAKKGLYQLIKELKKDERTIVIITHEVDYIEGVCDRAVILKNGKICYNGNPHLVTEKMEANRKITAKYEHIIDEQIAKTLLPYINIDQGEKRIEAAVSSQVETKTLLNNIINAYEITSLNIEDTSIREVLEDVLKKMD